ncbi:transcriptional regulator, TetR family [Conexibacter woesei DSM 14684]|uniref:Transcriptional regulator, TetR family n=1 Tax=Conexibacter woesei (strain DSM 14684 / CCUG 47730 / CIP 108061 / JCM 11494 / NBRC 100937 / ID131577) TaxID=469383 RepID=D3FDV5_CONWI|nr:transcriptional regulator, TetR family [Conexibacter woesei DSM 14684]
MFSERVYGREVPAASDRSPQRLPRGRHGLPRRFVVHNQRERMLLAVAEAVAEQGYATTTVADIIARARLSRRTFYEHFTDKEECFLAAYDTVVEQMLAGVGHAYEHAGDDWTHRVHDGLEAFVNYLVAEPAFARMCIVEVVAAGTEARGRRDAAMRVFVDFLQPGREQAPRGVVVPELAADIVVGGIYEIIYTRLLRDSAEELIEMLPQLVYCALVPFVGHRAAERAVRENEARKESERAAEHDESDG